MATVPSAKTTVQDTAGAQAGGTDLVCVIAPVPQSADAMPRLFGNAPAVKAQHGYCEGVEYAAMHFDEAGKSCLFVGVPIATAGVIGRVDKSGNTGSSVASVTAGGSGVLHEHDGSVVVVRGGTIGTDQIVLSYSLDDGFNFKTLRLGTASSYVLPDIGVTLSFAAGTLVAGDPVITWHGSGPRSDSSGWADAFDALGEQQLMFRSVVLVGDLQSHTEAAAFRDNVKAYRVTSERFIKARASVKDRLPQAELSKDVSRMTGTPSLTFAASGHTVTRAAGSWIADGFVTGDVVTFAGTASNNFTAQATVTSATVLTFASGCVNETVGVATAVAVPGLTFAEVGSTGDTITRSRGSWVADGFRAGDIVTVAGTSSNNVTTDGLTSVSPLVLTLDTTDLAAEVIGTGSPVSITAGQTIAAWAAALESEFETVSGGSDDFRIDLAAGRGRIASPYSEWNYRRSPAWLASCREYQHDLHIPTWRKSDGPIGVGLKDINGTRVEYDDRPSVDGGALSAARFTSFRTWGNGPPGAFISQSLTRGDDGSLLSQSHNVDVVNIACTTVQLNSENVIGQVLILNKDGTATPDSIARIEAKINAALALALRTDRGEGPRASSAVWKASVTDVLNVPNALMTGVLQLNLNGTVHDIATTVRVS